MTNQKDRLLKLLDDFYYTIESITRQDISDIADCLLENGVIVPPCKVGDTIYEAIFYSKGKFSHWNECQVVGFHLGGFPKLRGIKRNQYIVVWHRVPNCITHINLDNFGKTVFFKHQIEEAEKVLRGDNNQ